MFENPRRGRQARNFTTNVPKILDLKSSSEQIFSENCRWVSLINWQPSSERRQENACYKRLICKQFVQVSGLCGPQLFSYLPKLFTHLCRAFYGDVILVYSFGAPIGRRKSTKTVHFFYKNSFFFSLEN